VCLDSTPSPHDLLYDTTNQPPTEKYNIFGNEELFFEQQMFRADIGYCTQYGWTEYPNTQGVLASSSWGRRACYDDVTVDLTADSDGFLNVRCQRPTPLPLTVFVVFPLFLLVRGEAARSGRA
jgi:hypothetical protein